MTEQTLEQELDARREAIKVGSIVHVLSSPYDAIVNGQVFQVSAIDRSDFDGKAILFYVIGDRKYGESGYPFYIHEIDLISNNNKEEN